MPKLEGGLARRRWSSAWLTQVGQQAHPAGARGLAVAFAASLHRELANQATAGMLEVYAIVILIFLGILAFMKSLMFPQDRSAERGQYYAVPDKFS